MKSELKTFPRVLPGNPVSPGYAIAPIFIVKPKEQVIRKRRISPGEVPEEINRYKRALDTTAREITTLKKKLLKKVGKHEARIFDAHLNILKDPEVNRSVIKDIETNHMNAEHTYFQVMKKINQQFDSVTDPFFRDRLGDIEAVSRKVLEVLQPDLTNYTGNYRDLDFPSIIFIEEMSPFDLAQLDFQKTLGIVMDKGGDTSHVSILARSMEIPAISGITLESLSTGERELVILDGIEGNLITSPNAREIAKHETKKARYFELNRRLFELRNFDSATQDKKHIQLSANIELPVEVDKVLLYGGTSVGLFRSEFIFLTQRDAPTEEEQTQIYKYIAERMQPGSVVIRTFDSGGDKLLPGINLKEEENPFMGWRSIRVCLGNIPIFKTQLRAILRASIHKNIKIMFPMISELDELLRSRKILKEVMEDLDKEKIRYNKSIKIGCMIEVPSAVLIADSLAEYCDFFSVGTNDLIQFTLAVDRGNKQISEMYQPHHPAVIRFIQMIVDAAKRKKIPVSVCGEMAGNPLSAALLIGLGVEELSMRASSLLKMKKFIRSLTLKELKTDAKKMLTMNSAQKVNHFLEDRYSELLKKMEFPSHSS